MAARRDTHGVPAWPGLLHAADPELTTGRGVFRHHVVSFDTTKTNSSSYFFHPCDGCMLLDMASDFLTRTLNCLAVQNRSDEKAEMV